MVIDGGRMDDTVSVVMPTYNRSRFIERAIRSVLGQTCPVKEVIVVDDGSTDGTEDVLRTIPGPIRYFKQANAGPPTARNHGFKQVTGAFIALLDSDDVWFPDKIERQLACVRANDRVGLVHSAARIIDSEGRVTGAVWGRSEYHGRVTSHLLEANGVNASSVLMRRALVEAEAGYDIRFPALENWDLWLRISRRCEFAYVNEPLIEYRLHDGGWNRDLDRLRCAYQMLLDKHVLGGHEPPGWRKRRHILARFHQAMADALVGQERYLEAEKDFLKSLIHRPEQAAVWWRMFRVASELGLRRIGLSSLR